MTQQELIKTAKDCNYFGEIHNTLYATEDGNFYITLSDAKKEAEAKGLKYYTINKDGKDTMPIEFEKEIKKSKNK
jgi:GH43 family beta-xylosidase